VRSIVAGLAWLLAALVISLGAAGIVARMDRSAGGSDGTGLTTRGDAIVDAHLDVAATELEAMSADVDALGVQARGALAALVASDPDTAATALATGDELIVAIRSRTARVSAALADVPLLDTLEGRYQVSDRARDRHTQLAQVLEATRDLEGAWASLAIASVAASRLSSLLSAHDDAVLAAATFGRKADYDNALTTLFDAESAITDARRLRDQLARSIDVTTLDAWLDRNAEYDAALTALYRAVVEADGRVTNAVRSAAQAEADARARLPADSRGLILIMSEIGRGGMNAAVIAIEQTRGKLADALAESVPSPAP
jgi:hypothetical protein